MRKLFNTGSFITIDDFYSVRIAGPYALLTLGPDYAKVKSGDYIIEAIGKELFVETLSEEIAVFTFESITNLKITMDGQGENLYDS